MTLKDAYRYLNFLSKIFRASSMALREDCLFPRTETHFKKSANPDAEDEIVEECGSPMYTCDNDTFLKFMIKIVEEQVAITKAIEYTKLHTYHHVPDELIMCNRLRRALTSELGKISQIRPKVSKSIGTDYRLNVEGNQVPYSYKVETVSHAGFDVDYIKSVVKKYNAEADADSESVDRLMLDIDVDFDPFFDINDYFGDCVERFEKFLTGEETDK